MRQLLLFALLSSVPACTERPVGEDTDTSSPEPATTSSTSTATTDVTPTTGDGTSSGTTGGTEALCLDASYHAAAPMPWELTCGLPELCPGEDVLVFTLGAAKLLAPETVEVDDLERARCIIQALRDRAVGQFSWYVIVDSHVIFDPLSLELLGDAALSRSVRGGAQSPGPDNTHEGLYALRPPEFFAACEGGDAMALWLCLVDAVVPACLPGPLPCPD